MLSIQILRTLKGLSARELARRLGVPASTWHRIEHGERPVPAELLPQIARELSLSSADLGVTLRLAPSANGGPQ